MRGADGNVACYGIAPQDMGTEWECELCANANSEEAHLVGQGGCRDCFADLIATSMCALPAGRIGIVDKSEEETACRL